MCALVRAFWWGWLFEPSRFKGKRRDRPSVLLDGAGSLSRLLGFVAPREALAFLRGHRVGWQFVTSQFCKRVSCRLFVLVGGVGDSMGSGEL